MFTQLNPPIPLETPKGAGLAYGVIDYGPDYDLLWVVFDDATGECWTWRNPQIVGVKNVTHGRRTGLSAFLPRGVRTQIPQSGM
jgi:hypothetical protein